jgi:hypothetical protein
MEDSCITEYELGVITQAIWWLGVGSDRGKDVVHVQIVPWAHPAECPVGARALSSSGVKCLGPEYDCLPAI